MRIKKSTQRILMTLSIIIIFGMSSITFVFFSFGHGGSVVQDNQIEPLDGFVIDGEIDPRLESAYVQGGFTFLKFYHNSNTSADVISYVEQAPNVFTTANGQTQLIVQKIESPANYMKIINLNGERDIFNTTQSDVFSALCDNLLVLPTECALLGLNLSS